MTETWDAGTTWDEGVSWDQVVAPMTPLVPAVVFPDAATLAATWLARDLAAQGVTIPVGLRLPNPRPNRFISIVRTGGVLETPVTEAAQLSFSCWGPDDVAAGQLAQLARALLYNMVGVDQGGGVMVRHIAEVQGPQYLPFPDTTQPRYLFTLRLSLRGTPLPQGGAPAVTANP